MSTETAVKAAPAAKPAASRGSGILLAVTGIITLAGIALWAYQLTRGLIVTDMRNLTSWGLYIGTFTFFVGLSAGGLIIASIPRVFGLAGFKSVSKIAVWSSICCTVLAVALVVVDLGHPERIWHLVAYSNFTSPLMWDIIVITVYLIVSVVYLRATMRAEKGEGSEKALKVLSVVALSCAILVHSVTAWIFGLQIGRAFWNTALMAPVFITSALVSGLALVLVITLVLQKTGYLKRDQDMVTRMAGMLGVFVIVELFLFFCELLTAGYPAAGMEFETVKAMLAGPLAPMFWTEIVSGVLAAALLIGKKTAAVPALAGAGAALALLGAFIQKYEMLVSGFQFPNLTYWSVPTGPAAWSAGALVYLPTATEAGIVLGIAALGVFILTLGLKKLALKPAE